MVLYPGVTCRKLTFPYPDDLGYSHLVMAVSMLAHSSKDESGYNHWGLPSRGRIGPRGVGRPVKGLGVS